MRPPDSAAPPVHVVTVEFKGRLITAVIEWVPGDDWRIAPGELPFVILEAEDINGPVDFAAIAPLIAPLLTRIQK